MSSAGLSVQELTRHLSECPEIFIEEPVQPSGHGGVYVHAVISDLLLSLGGKALSSNEADRFRYAHREAVRAERNRLRVALLASWLFSHSGFDGGTAQERADQAARVHEFLASGLEAVAGLISAERFLSDPDRREELARLGLRAVRRTPDGESVQEAKNRLTALSSVERERVLVKARQAEERARVVAARLAAQQAAEAAANSYYNE